MGAFKLITLSCNFMLVSQREIKEQQRRNRVIITWKDEASLLRRRCKPFSSLHMCLTLSPSCAPHWEKTCEDLLRGGTDWKRRPEARGRLFIDVGHTKLPLISQVHHSETFSLWTCRSDKMQLSFWQEVQRKCVWRYVCVHTLSHISGPLQPIRKLQIKIRWGSWEL